jgi:hypothetical protein
LVTESCFDPFGPGFIEFDAIDARDDVDADRLHSDLEDESGLRQILYGKIMKGRAEFLQSGDSATSVAGLRSDPNIQVLGRPNQPVSGKRVGAYNDEFNAVGVEFG